MAKFEPFKIGENTESVAKFVKTTCLHPVKRMQYNNHLRKFVEVHLPCGHCDNCQYKLQQRWIERMEVHSLSNPYCYFVTLTYDSNFLLQNQEYQNELNCYTGADGRPVPLTLCYTHARDFLNRLRKQTGKYGQFTYFGCGEYGDDTCRPHFHFLLWSKSELSHYNLRKAWSLASKSIGICWIADLHSNGTFGISKDMAKVIGFKRDVKPTFSYVCKYMCKYKRFMKAPYEAKLREKFDSLGPNACGVVVLPYKINTVNYDKSEKYGYDWEAFKKAFRPRTFCSTRCAIGSEYFYQHFEDFAGSVTRRVTLPTGSTVQVSGYYSKIIKKRLSPFYCRNFVSESFTSARDYQGVCQMFREVCADSSLFDYRMVFEDRRLDTPRPVVKRPYAFILGKFYDPIVGCWYHLRKRYNGYVYMIRKFDRHLRKYVLCGFQSLKDFALEYIKKSQQFLQHCLPSAQYTEKLDDMYDNWIEMSAKLSGVTLAQAQLYVDTARSAYVGSLKVAQEKYYAEKKLKRKFYRLVM